MFLIFHFVAAVKTTSNLKTRGLESLAYFLQPPKQRINRAEFKFIAATLPAKVNIIAVQTFVFTFTPLILNFPTSVLFYLVWIPAITFTRFIITCVHCMDIYNIATYHLYLLFPVGILTLWTSFHVYSMQTYEVTFPVYFSCMDICAQFYPSTT